MLLPVHQNASASSSTCSPRRRRALMSAPVFLFALAVLAHTCYITMPRPSRNGQVPSLWNFLLHLQDAAMTAQQKPPCALSINSTTTTEPTTTFHRQQSKRKKKRCLMPFSMIRFATRIGWNSWASPCTWTLPDFLPAIPSGTRTSRDNMYNRLSLPMPFTWIMRNMLRRLLQCYKCYRD